MGEADSRLGQTIGGRYHIDGRLGRGGFGTVYAARDANPARPRDVALKALRFEAFEDPERARRYLRREVEVLDRMSHPHIVRLFDVVEDDGTVFLVMERLRGRTLATALDDAGVLPPLEALRITLSIAEALRALAAEDCVHRDVKPANLFLAEEGAERPVPKLMDFGLAADRFGSVQHTRDTVLGTLGYMPPEAFRDGRPDDRYDVWSLGVVLYEMLQGQRPFGAPGDTEATIIGKILHGDLPPLTSMPRRWATLLRERLLVRDPARRADIGTLIHWLRAEQGADHTARLQADPSTMVALDRPTPGAMEHLVLRGDGGLRGARVRGHLPDARLRRSPLVWPADADAPGEALVTGRWSLSGHDVQATVVSGTGQVELATVSLGPSAGPAMIAELLAAGLEDLPRIARPVDDVSQLRLSCILDGRRIDWTIPLRETPGPSARLGQLALQRLRGPLAATLPQAGPTKASPLRRALVVGGLAGSALVSLGVIAVGLRALGGWPDPSAVAARGRLPLAETPPVAVEPPVPVEAPVPVPTRPAGPSRALADPDPASRPPAPTVRTPEPIALNWSVTPRRTTVVPDQAEVALTVATEPSACRRLELDGASAVTGGTVVLPLPAGLHRRFASSSTATVPYRLRCLDPATAWSDHTLVVEPFPEF